MLFDGISSALPLGIFGGVAVQIDAVETRAVSRRIQALLAAHRRQAPKIDDGEQHWAVVSDHVGPSGLRGIVGIPTFGCAYARTGWGGCSVCGHASSMLWNGTLSNDEIVRDVQRSLSSLDAVRPAHICLYTSGSFLDDSELPPPVRQTIIASVQCRSWVNSISIESLPQFVTQRSLDQLRSYSGDLKIHLGMGVDSTDEFVRAVCFQRHIASRLYIKALQACNSMDVDATAYVVYKPPFLTEEEAVFDTAQSTAVALNWGFSRVSIEPVALQSGTLQQHLFDKGLYVPPTFWGVVSAVVQSCALGDDIATRLLLGGQVFTPLPTSVLRACEFCQSTARPLLAAASTIFAGLPTKLHDDLCGRGHLVRPTPIDSQLILQRIEEIIG